MPENKLISKIMHRVFDRVMNAGLMQEELTAEGQRYITEGMPELLRQAGAESCVLLENDGVLPLDKNKSIAVFGRCQLDWFYVGYGSGGDVSAPYYVNFMQGLANAGAAYDKEISEIYRTWCESREHMADHGWWGHWPMSHPEMPLDEDAVKAAAKRADTAVVVIGRAAGEDRENTLTEGSYYLTAEELRMLDLVTSAFSRTAIVLNIGNIIDMSWISKYKASISAVLVAWMGGMESGNAVCDVLFGKTSPCGKLPDSIAKRYEDYPSAANFGGKAFNEYAEDIFMGYRYFDLHPEKVLYPFGFGLSYTSFKTEAGKHCLKTC